MSDASPILANTAAATALATLRQPLPKPTVKLGADLGQVMWQGLRDRLEGLKKSMRTLALFSDPLVKAAIAKEAADLYKSYGDTARQIGQDTRASGADAASQYANFTGNMKQLTGEMDQVKTIYLGLKQALDDKAKRQPTRRSRTAPIW